MTMNRAIGKQRWVSALFQVGHRVRVQRRHHSVYSGSSLNKADLGRGGQNKFSTSAAGTAQQQLEVDSWELNLSGADEAALQGRRGDWWWSGKAPSELVGPNGVLHSLPQPTLESVTETQVRDYFDNTWALTEVLFSSLQGERAFYRPPYHHLRHPMIFYYGHTATFYTNKLRVAGLVEKGINPYFEDIFEVGVDEMRWDDMSKNAMEWPTVGEVHEYRRETYKLVNEVIDNNVRDAKVDQDHPLWSLFMSFEHDRIHLETSSVLLRELPLELLRKPEYFPQVHPSGYRSSEPSNPRVGVDYPENELLQVNGLDNVEYGKFDEFPTFGWDNEYGNRRKNVPSFQAGKYQVSNGEFFEFVVDGGYCEKQYWSADGWAWRTFRNAKWPYFWQQSGPAGSHEYKLRTVFEEVSMPWDWPVNVNKHEATAFCNWKASKGGKNLRLITEAEHYVLREENQRPPLTRTADDPVLLHGGDTISTQAGVNLNLAYGSESPVDFHEPNGNGFYDVTGNAWEWSEDDFNPLGGFKVHKYYDDFSSPCFDGEHNMILGGSFISSGDAGANLHCRYHFRPHFLQHSGFRYVAPDQGEAWPGQGVAVKLNNDEEVNVYETKEAVNQYLALHFGQSDDVVDKTIVSHDERPSGALNFPKRCADLLGRFTDVSGHARALDLGCAVGGSTFELAKTFNHVTGVDFSNGFIDVAKKIRDCDEDEMIEFQVPVEGSIKRTVRVKRPVPHGEIDFVQGDACDLRFLGEKKFDAVLLANLLCRLPDPEACLVGLRDIVRDGGVTLIVSPFSWMEDFTEGRNWLQQGDEESRVAVKRIMEGSGFKEIHSQEMPLFIREHERKYQYIVSHAQVFRRAL